METIHEQISAIGLEINALVEQRGTLAQALAADPANPTHRAAMRQLNGQIANLEADEQALQQALAAQAEMAHAARMAAEADALAELKSTIEKLKRSHGAKALELDKALTAFGTALQAFHATTDELQNRQNEYTRRTVPAERLRAHGYSFSVDFMDPPARGIAARLAGLLGGSQGPFRNLVAFNIHSSDEPITSYLLTKEANQ
ncbi:hypothetical protein J4G66_02275 [Aeromonas dhakensis]|uniref:hypothetical protein n=1 Tax=Aeromonas dhakensis TaxID=196024 RepID=UPI001BD0DD8B|nr:hypothetical protein [Aeromonas dhakensis]MBS4714798.1 hypothetical protein [Aeromonas dhakensis]